MDVNLSFIFEYLTCMYFKVIWSEAIHVSWRKAGSSKNRSHRSPGSCNLLLPLGPLGLMSTYSFPSKMASCPCAHVCGLVFVMGCPDCLVPQWPLLRRVVSTGAQYQAGRSFPKAGMIVLEQDMTLVSIPRRSFCDSPIRVWRRLHSLDYLPQILCIPLELPSHKAQGQSTWDQLQNFPVLWQSTQHYRWFGKMGIVLSDVVEVASKIQRPRTWEVEVAL